MPKTNAKYLFILLAVLIAPLAIISSVNIVKTNKVIENTKQEGAKVKAFRPDHVGEKITYDIKLTGVSLGKMRFANLAIVEINGKLLNIIEVETKLAHFIDKEKIYSDPETLLPIKVERDIRNWLSREKITEEYDQDNFSVTIIKNKGNRQGKTVIKKDSYIHNAMLLPHYVRRIPKLEVGKTIIANLPNRRFEIKLVDIEDIKVPAGIFKAYHFQSTPKQIEIWLSTDERRIPVKIQGTGAFGYAMSMQEYNS